MIADVSYRCNDNARNNVILIYSFEREACPFDAKLLLDNDDNALTD